MSGNIRNAVAEREQSSQAPARVSQAALIRQAIEVQGVAFQSVLPNDVDSERFGRLVLTAVKSTPKLMEAFATEQGKASVLYAAMQCATIGLEPNTPTQEAWLLPRKNGGVTEAELNIGYRGYLKLARRNGEVKTIFAGVVREGDHFKYARGAEADVFEHEERADEDAPLTHTYAVVRFVNGGYNFIVLRRGAVEQRRAKSTSWSNSKSRPYSPWTTSEESMWRKSAVRALVPYLDLTPAAAAAVTNDESAFKLDADGTLLAIPDDVIDIEEEAPAEETEVA